MSRHYASMRLGASRAPVLRHQTNIPLPPDTVLPPFSGSPLTLARPQKLLPLSPQPPRAGTPQPRPRVPEQPPGLKPLFKPAPINASVRHADEPGRLWAAREAKKARNLGILSLALYFLFFFSTIFAIRAIERSSRAALADLPHNTPLTQRHIRLAVLLARINIVFYFCCSALFLIAALILAFVFPPVYFIILPALVFFILYLLATIKYT